MSKELVISASSHERRVAILEEGQLVEIYIEREKEFALVGSIYKGRVTRVLPGMQSAFVDIGLDGDAFLYVSDVFENLEDHDIDHDHGHVEPHANGHSAPQTNGGSSNAIELLPGETLGRSRSDEGAGPTDAEARGDEAHHEEHGHTEAAGEEHGTSEEADHAESEVSASSQGEGDPAEERQPDSNASAPQNFGNQYNPTQKYSSRHDRGPRDFGRGGDRGSDRGGRGRWGRRGGRNRGGRPQQGGPGGRNLPPSKYASPQGDQRGPDRGHDRGHDRGYDRGPGRFDNRRQGQDAPRYSKPQGPSSGPSDSAEEPILLPGESLAKYRGKPAGALPVAEPEQAPAETQEQVSEEFSPRASAAPAVSGPGSNVPRRSSGGLPRWLLADAGAETDTSSTGMEEIGETAADTSSASQHVVEEQAAEGVTEVPGIEAPLSEEEAVVLSTALVEAKHEETQAEAEADSLAGGAEFGEEEVDEEAEEVQEIAGSESEAIHVVEEEELVEEEIDDEEESEEASAESDADAAHEAALREVAADGPSELHLPEHSEPVEATASERTEGDVPKQEEFLLPGETRSSTRSGEGQGERQEYPRESARIGGGNPRARFQRPYRGGGRDRGRDNRGGRPDRRGGRPGGHRFDRRPGGGGGGPQRGHGHHHGGHSGPSRRPQLISEMLKAGQDVVVQIAKEPLGKKGARITSHIALPGRFLVYMPTIDHIGVSRKIASAENRSRLRRLVGEARGSYPGGFIVRTAAGGASDDEIRADIEFLGRSWNEIKERNEQRKAPALLHRDLNLVERILRDYVSDDFTGIWIDNEEEYGKIVEFVSRFQPKLISKVKLYSKEMPIFEEFGIQHELDKALRAKVWLKSGGYIVINHTEALVAIDVNTGKFVGKGSTRLEDTIVKTNLEAVKEIVRQIRLRDLGGIIVVDFIDMEERRNREKVLSALQMALEQDKAPSKALSFNEFGLVCITRKRTKQALERVLCQPCPYCTGSGMVKSVPTLCYEIQAEARKMAIADHENPNLTLRVHPEIAKALKTRESMLIDELEQNSHKHVIIQSDATLHWEQYDIY